MQLEQVEALDPEPPQRGLNLLAQVPIWISAAHHGIVLVGTWPLDRLRLRGDVDPVARPAMQRLPDHGLAVAGTVQLGGIDEVDALLVGTQ